MIGNSYRKRTAVGEVFSGTKGYGMRNAIGRFFSLHDGMDSL